GGKAAKNPTPPVRAHKPEQRGYWADAVVAAAAVFHSNVIFTSSPVEIRPRAIFGAGGWMPKLVIFTLVEPVVFIRFLSTRVMVTGKATLLVTPATASSPLLSKVNGPS